MTTTQLLDEIRTLTNSNLAVIQKKIKYLNQTQVNWKPNETTWSINEIFAHLNEYAKFYHSTFIKRIEATRFKEPRENFISSPMGRSAWKAMKLGKANNVKRKFHAAKAYNPTMEKSLLTGHDVESFSSNQLQLLEIVELATKVNIRRIKVPIPISKIIRLRLGDALLYVGYHNERHMQQALNLLNHRNFPKK
jgi:hypothetical protein